MAEEWSYLKLSDYADPIRIKTVPDWSSRESLGVWKIDGLAYKIWYKEKSYKKALQNLLDAGAKFLPVPAWSTVVGGSIKLETEKMARWRECWIIRAVLVDNGTKWTFQDGDNAFRAAIHEVDERDIIRRCKRACTAAIACGLRDPQGFVIKHPGPGDPLLFIDVHTTKDTTQVTLDMQEIVQERATELGA